MIRWSPRVLTVLILASAAAGCASRASATDIGANGIRYQPPRRLTLGRPRYPKELKEAGVEADVPVAVQVDPTGRVTGVRILRETPYPELNESARACAVEERYQPATRDGVPIPWTLSYTIRFRLVDQ